MYNVETVQQNLKAIATAHADFAKTSFEQSKTYVAQLAQVKSLDQAVELNTQYAKTA
jgi:Phasin protein